MKNIIFIILACMALNAGAHTIKGTLVLKGTLKSKLMVDGAETTCKVQVEKIWNLQVEDSYGNPGYSLRMDIGLSGFNSETSKSVRLNQKAFLTNMFKEGNESIVKDLEYASEKGDVTMQIKEDGRLSSVSFNYNQQKITCSF